MIVTVNQHREWIPSFAQEMQSEELSNVVDDIN